MFEDWSIDVDQADDDNPAGHVNRQEVVVPSRRHLELYRLLRSNSHRDQAGRLISWWTQPKLAAGLSVSVRTLRNLLADLRQPGLDPRHPRGQPPGLRLALVKVEATTYRDQATGRHRLGANRYVLDPRQQATLKAPPTSVDSGDVACLNKSTPLSLEGKGGLVSLTGVGETEDDATWPAYADSRWHHGPGRRGTPTKHSEPAADPIEIAIEPPASLELDHDPSRAEILAALEAGLDPVEVRFEWRNDPSPPVWKRPRSKLLPLDGETGDLYAALIQLENDTCSSELDRCQPGHRCRRHSRRNPARG